MYKIFLSRSALCRTVTSEQELHSNKIYYEQFFLSTVKKVHSEESDLPEVDQNTNKALRQRQAAAVKAK